MSAFGQMNIAEPGRPIMAADIAPVQVAVRALAQAVGPHMSLDQTAVAFRRLGRRRDDIAMLRVTGRVAGAESAGLWDWVEVGLVRRKTPPIRYEWKDLKRSSAKGQGPLWMPDMHDNAGARGFSHSDAVPVLAVRMYRRNTQPFWVGQAIQPSLGRPFLGRVGSFAVLGPNRWTYQVAEVERRLVVASELWVDLSGQVPAGRVVSARCLAEENNTATGVQGHGVNVTGPGFPAGFATQPIPVGSIVVVYPVLVRPALGLPERLDYLFERTNGVDGTC